MARWYNRAFFHFGAVFDTMKKYPFFIFLFALYPSFALLTWNFREVDAGAILRPLLFSIMISSILFLIGVSLIKSLPKAILISTIFILFFFSFGHISISIERSKLASSLGLGSWLITVILSIVTLLILFFLCRAVLKSNQDLTSVYPTLNILSLFLVLSSSFLLVNRFFARQTNPSSPQQLGSEQSATGPDVYYIILDAYGRQDSLKKLEYDNSTFVSELEDIGFYVPSCSRSNYPQTVMSMASSLNMGYLWEVLPNQGSDDRNSEPVYAGILNSRVRQEFETRGYQIMVFDSGVDWLNWRDVDKFVAPPSKPLFSAQLDSFEYIFLDTTALHPLMTQPFFLRNKYVHNYNRIHYVLDELPRLARSEGPKFVYVHMLIPHRPNIFLPDGSMNLTTDYYKKGVGEGVTREYDREGYLNNMKFINSRLPDVIREIIQSSQIPPIIILQGDHGYQLPDIRFDILNAYYFPDRNYAALYPEITPVNTFRVVLNTYFDEEYTLLKDQSINVGINRPYGKKTTTPGECP